MRQALASVFASAALASFWSQPAQAIPHVYAGLVLGVNSMQACLSQAEKIAKKNGFTDNIEVVGSGSMQDFHADHNDKPLSITVSCSTKLGGAAIAVAGMNNDDTFAMIRKVYDDF
jgi:hypothetical protein